MLNGLCRALKLPDPQDVLRLGSAAKPRSPQWSGVEHEQRQQFPTCYITGSKLELEVHHVLPFHLYPEYELESWNLRTLTREVHFLVGHCRSWSHYNIDFENDAAWCRTMLSKARDARQPRMLLQPLIASLKERLR